MEPIKAMVIMGPEKLFDEKHCTIDVWPDVSEYERPMRRLSSMPMEKGTCIQFSGQVYCRPALQVDEGVWSGWSIRATFF